MSSTAHLLCLSSALLLAVVFACHERAPLRFSHEQHLSKIRCGTASTPDCLSCASCHKSAPGTEPQHPRVSECEDCHREDALQKFERSVRPAREPSPSSHAIAFDHVRHLEMPAIKGQCVDCHTGALKFESTLFPPMARCFECHEHQEQFDRGQCGPCHQPGDVERLLPQTFMRHDSSWPRHHGHEAQMQGELCQSCHTQSECDDCHDTSQGVSIEQRRPDALERNFVHRADFITRHAMEARSQPATCSSCHTPQSCDACHTRRGVSGNALDARNPHPPGWSSGNPASRNFHGRAARRDILSCAGCHDRGPATNCIDCHRVGGPGGNPHPNGFFSARSEGDAMCRYCHVE